MFAEHNCVAVFVCSTSNARSSKGTQREVVKSAAHYSKCCFKGIHVISLKTAMLTMLPLNI